MAKQRIDQELCEQAVRVLSDDLGPVDAVRFLALVSREPFDYQEWRRDWRGNNKRRPGLVSRLSDDVLSYTFHFAVEVPKTCRHLLILPRADGGLGLSLRPRGWPQGLTAGGVAKLK